MKRIGKILALLLAGVLALSGCSVHMAEDSGAVTPEPTEAPEPTKTPYTPLKGEEVLRGANGGFTEFDSTLIAFLEQSGYGKENFMVSPLSFRAALALAVSGADGETEAALLNAMGFADLEEVTAWYADLLERVDGFAADLEEERARQRQYPEDYGGAESDRAFRVANSVWHNADRGGNFGADYVDNAARWFGAAAENVPAAELTGAVNDWVNRETHGMIPVISNDLSQVDAVLVNALYLRTSWLHTFGEYSTHTGNFTTVDGDTAEKDFMRQQDSFAYYEDGDTQLVVLPMKGNMKAVFVLGDTGDIRAKLDGAERREVIVTLPKFEIETTLDSGELTDYLAAMGAGVALTGDADFSVMCPETPWCIGDIIQKSKIKVDEDGIEAAAVTAILMNATAMEPDPVQPKEFTADRPFTFYLYSDYGDTPELLFYGQYVR